MLNDIHKFIVDKEAEKIIKNIFKMALNGMSRQEIIKKLNESHIPTPSKYLKDFCNSKNPHIGNKWTLSSLDKVLKNKNYIGTLIQGKKTRLSHKKHNTLRVPEDEWIIVPDHHKAIISEAIFNQVQEILYNRNSRVSSNGKMYRYTGYLKCADCHISMYKFSYNKGETAYFYCGSYHKKKVCSKHHITEKELDDILLESINKFIELISNLDKKISSNISLSYMEYEKENKQFKLIELDKGEKKYRKLLNDIKEDYKNDYISKKDLDRFKDRYLFQLNKILIEKEKIKNSNFSNENIDRINRIKKLGKFDYIDRNILQELIDVIYIHENLKVEVVFKYKKLYEDALRYLND